MSVTLVGSVGTHGFTAGDRVTSGTTITSTYGQTPTAGNLLVAFVTRVGSTATASPTSTGPGGGWTRLLPTNFVTNIGVGSATACDNLVDAWWKKATGSETNGDATFTMTLAGGTTTFAMTCAIYELSGANTTSPLDVSGTQSSGSGSSAITTVTTTTSANVTKAGEFAISCATRERAAGTPTITYSASWTNGANDGAVSSVAHTGVAHLAGPSSGATASDVTSFSGTGTTAFSAGAIVVIAAAAPTSGPLIDAPSNPVGVRVILQRTGAAFATALTAVTVPPPPVTTGPPFFPVPWPARARVPQNAPRGRTAGSAGGPVRNPSHGPVFRQAAGPARARIPQTALNTSERVRFGPGAPVPTPPATGPLFRPAVQAIRARQPQYPFLKGRCYSSPPAPVQNPQPGPVFRQKPSPVRFVLPPWQPRAGRIGSSPGGPVINPIRGPTFTPAPRPAQARRPLPARGRVYATPKPAVLAAPPAVTPFFPARQPARSRIPRNTPRGRAWSNPGAPVANPNVVAVYGAASGPVRAALPVVLRGRTASAAGRLTQVITPAPFFPLSHPVQARIPLPPRGRTSSNRGAPVRNPQQGPVFSQAARPAQARIPQVFSKGRTSSNSGSPVRNPSQGPVFRQATVPARIRPSLPPRGRTASNPGGPVVNPVPPVQGPVFVPRHDPARIRPSLPPRGRVSANPGAPVRNPAAGPAFRQATVPVRARQPLPLRGRVASNPGAPVVPLPPAVVTPYVSRAVAARIPLPGPNSYGRAATMAALIAPPAVGPVFRPAVQAVRAKLPLQPFLTGRTASNQGGPVRNPSPGGTGPVFFPARQPARIRPSLPPRGRAAGNLGGPVRNPAPVTTGPLLTPRSFVKAQLPPPGEANTFGRAATMVALPVPPAPVVVTAAPQPSRPVRARTVPVPRGRTSGSPGAPAGNPSHGPAFRQAPQPARIRPSLPSRGRVGSSPGGPVRNPVQPTFSSGQPAGVRVVYVAAGRAATMVAIPVPANPRPGPVFRQAVQPARARIPQNAPRGRTASNPGGPVQNIPLGNPLFRLGSPYFQWEAGTPGLVSEWATGNPYFRWETGVPVTSS
jgi:hypothetical protein